MAMSYLKGLKEAVSKSELTAAGHAMLGGGVASVGHYLISTKVAFFDSGLKRAGLALGIGVLGAHYVGKKSKNAGMGVAGAMGGVVAIELWTQFAGAPSVAHPAVTQQKTSGLIGRLGNSNVMLPSNMNAFGATSSPLMQIGGARVQGTKTQALSGARVTPFTRSAALAG